MTRFLKRAGLAALPAALLLALTLPAADDKKADPASAASNIRWKKTVLDKAFRSEGVAVADVNRDGKLDVLNGEFWYEAPDWKPHEIRKPGNYGNGLGNYSQSFACWADDLNGDGWPDLVVVGFPGDPCYWYENPKGAAGHWKRHEIWHSACNETPLYTDLLGDGRRVLVMGWQPKGGPGNQGQMAYFTPAKDPYAPWEMHAVSAPSAPGKEVPGTQRFSHGLGVGDVNGDGRLDVIVTAGWWEQPATRDATPWAFHPANLGEASADLYAYDLDGDGRADVVASSAHHFGIWWFQQKGARDRPDFVRRDLFPRLVSETHALVLADVNGDGLKDLVTGKRFWSHGKSEPGADMPARVYWFEARKGKDGLVGFTPHEIDDDSGIGTQFAVTDINGDKLPDVVTSNKKGTFLLEQVRDAR